MSDPTTLVQLLNSTGKVTLPPNGWRFETRTDSMFLLVQSNLDVDNPPEIHVTENPTFAPGNIVGNYDPGETLHEKDKFEYPTSEPSEFAKWMQMKINLTRD